MPDVVGDKIRDSGFTRQLDYGFIIRVGGGRLPGRGQRLLLGQQAERIQILVHLAVGKPERGDFPMEDFMIFARHRVAENERPAPRAEQLQQFMRRAGTGPQSGHEHIGIEHGAEHRRHVTQRREARQGRVGERSGIFAGCPMIKFVLMLALWLVPGFVPAQSNAPARYYFAIEDIAAKQVVLRRASTKEQLPREDIILAPDTRYREWLYWVEANLIGFVEFTTPPAGNRFTIPKVSLGKCQSRDSDGDGLSDDAEFVIGTNPTNPDTDNDGINDGAAVKLGIDAKSSRTGIIGTTDTPGTAVDVCAFNNIVAVADSGSGVSIFNVFNRMDPLIIAQVDTPGTATAVAISGNYLIVADGSAGVTILDISHPPDVPLVFQGSVGGTAQAVVASGDYAFVGTVEGNVTMIELSSASGLQSLNLGGRVEDLAIEGETLYAYANGSLKVIPITQGILAVAGSVSSPAPSGINSGNGRGRIFVGGSYAYLVHTRGYNVFSVTNPAVPTLVLQYATNQFGWKQLALNGSGLMLAAASPNQGFDGPHNLWRFALTNPAIAATFETEFVTPGVARSIAIYNGLAYVADNTAGLQVIRYKETDFLKQPPSGVLTCTATTGSNGTVVVGAQVFFRASVADDVQVRNVEFYVDGVKAATDGNFPFEFGWRPPANTAGRQFVFNAIASDTGGNTTNLNTIQLTTTPDTQPPAVAIASPTTNSIFFAGDNLIIGLSAFDNVGIDHLIFMYDGVQVQTSRISLTHWLLRVALTPGDHQFSVSATDRSGLSTTSAPVAINVKGEAISREVSVFSWERIQPDAVSREVSAFLFDTRELALSDGVSREISVFSFEWSSEVLTDAISREWSIFNWELSVGTSPDGISREVSVERKIGP